MARWLRFVTSSRSARLNFMPRRNSTSTPTLAVNTTLARRTSSRAQFPTKGTARLASPITAVSRSPSPGQPLPRPPASAERRDSFPDRLRTARAIRGTSSRALWDSGTASHGARGTVQWGQQYSYMDRNTWSGAGATAGTFAAPHGVENMVYDVVPVLPAVELRRTGRLSSASPTSLQ